MKKKITIQHKYFTPIFFVFLTFLHKEKNKMSDDFIYEVLKNPTIPREEKDEMMRTFYWRYNNNERFRCSLNGYSLVFIEGIYKGVHNKEQTLFLRQHYFLHLIATIKICK